MKNLKYLVLACTALASFIPSGFSQNRPERSSERSSQKSDLPTQLDSEVIQHVYTSFGLVTTIHLATSQKIEDLRFGSPIFTFEYEEDRNLLHLMPRVESGVTNMNMMIGGKIHVFILHIESDPRVQYRSTFTMKDEGASQSALRNTPIMQPNEVPVVKLIRLIERIEIDPSFEKEIPGLVRHPIDQIYPWNGVNIHFLDVWQFPHIDTLVFRIKWQNTSNKLLHLNSRQYRLKASFRDIPITASTQNREHIYPGEMDEVYLFVQGHRLTPVNEWSIQLPPDEESVLRLFEK